jgi:hypothetical protein
MAVEIMALHAQDAFSDAKRGGDVLNLVRKHKPDAAVFAEAWHEGHDSLLDGYIDALRSQEYGVVGCLYADNDSREDRHGMLGIVRQRLIGSEEPYAVRMGTRNALCMPLEDPETGMVSDLFGIHLDDRREERRRGQANILVHQLVRPDRPTIVAGKFNAMYTRDPIARALRMTRWLTHHLPEVDPRPDVKPPRYKRVGSLARRSSDMACGTTMDVFTAAQFIDADPLHKPTKGPFAIDRIVYRGLAGAVRHHENEIVFKDQRMVRAAFEGGALPA